MNICTAISTCACIHVWVYLGARGSSFIAHSVHFNVYIYIYISRTRFYDAYYLKIFGYMCDVDITIFMRQMMWDRGISFIVFCIVMYIYVSRILSFLDI